MYKSHNNKRGSQMNQSFRGTVALITGGTSGIGQATALAFARAGAHVVLAARRSEQGDSTIALVRRAGGQATFVQTDVSQTSDVANCINQAVESYGRLDYLVNNAGQASVLAPTADQAEDNWDRIIGQHLKGTWLGMKYAIPHMLRQGSGAIVNISSIAGLAGNSFGVGPYIAAKHGVVGLTKATALEYAQQGIRVNAIAPGFVRTPMLTPMTGDTPEGEAPLGAMHPMGRIGTPEEIADAVIWLCSAQASFVTGHVLVVDGGTLAGTGA
jgi:NAD(P)-dependent dehydrogenase (short-subunit alcohol dehydrogenase family)